MPSNPRTPQNNMGEMRKRAGFTQRAAAEASGIPIGTLRRWEQGQNDPDMGSLMELAKLYGASLDSMLVVNSTNVDSVSKVGKTDSRPLPVFGRIAAGTPREALMQSDQTHDTPESLYRMHRESFWLTVSGNSMNRLFPDGSLVLIDPEIEVRNGDVGVVFVNGYDATLKRVYFDEGKIILHPESYDPEYMDTVIDGSDPEAPEVRIIGKAVSYTAPDNWRA